MTTSKSIYKYSKISQSIYNKPRSLSIMIHMNTDSLLQSFVDKLQYFAIFVIFWSILLYLKIAPKPSRKKDLTNKILMIKKLDLMWLEKGNDAVPDHQTLVWYPKPLNS